ncbi:K(+)-transporting ATPase subunit F [Mycobacterium sp. OAE908]
MHRPDAGDLRRARPGSEIGREPVSQNLVGLVLAVLLALFLFAALLFPERF